VIYQKCNVFGEENVNFSEMYERHFLRKFANSMVNPASEEEGGRKFSSKLPRTGMSNLPDFPHRPFLYAQICFYTKSMDTSIPFELHARFNYSNKAHTSI